MAYGPEDIQKVDAVNWVRRQRWRFFGGQATAVKLAEWLRDTAQFLGVKHATIDQHQDWTIVSADADWLQMSGCLGASWSCSPHELFHRIVPLPEAGQNSMRGEVLLTAFASEVVSATPHDSFVVSGSVPDDSSVWIALIRDGVERSVAFKGVVSSDGLSCEFKA